MTTDAAFALGFSAGLVACVLILGLWLWEPWRRKKPKLDVSRYFDPSRLSPAARALLSKPMGQNVCANCFLAAVTDGKYLHPCRSSTGLCTNEELSRAARMSGGLAIV